MVEQSDSGFNLKDDIASIWKDPTFHDVTIVCAEGVELGACRAVLAARCPVFKAMLYGNMREGSSHRVVLNDITSAVLDIVLGFIHTETIDNAVNVSVAVGIYRAASFLLLPKLMKMVLERAHDLADFGIASSLLNEAVAAIPWSKTNKDLYDVLLSPFRTHKLAIGELTDLSEESLELLLTEAATLSTPEYDLLLCVVDWVWGRNENAPSVSERHAVLHDINDMAERCDGTVRLGDGASRALLLKMMSHFDLTLVCPHRLKTLTEAVDAFTETSPHYMAFCHHACKNTICPTGHPSASRREVRHNVNLQWDQSKIGSQVIVSEDGQVVEFPSGSSIQTARLSVPGTKAHNGLCEWDIIVEAIGSYGNHGICIIGLVGEEFTHFDSYMNLRPHTWGFESCNDIKRTFGPGKWLNSDYGKRIQNGDVITLHLNLNDHTCAVSINGTNYGTAWRNLPDKVRPAVSLGEGSKYRIKDRRG